MCYDNMAAFKPYDALFLVLSLSPSESLFIKRRLIHTRVMNVSDEPWSSKPQIRSHQSCSPPETQHPSLGNYFNPMAAAAYGVEKKKINGSCKPNNHPSQNKTYFCFCCYGLSFKNVAVLPSVVFVCCECVLNRTLLCGQVHTE